MKKYKQFRAEQQYIAEVGPFASAMMVAMGAVGLGVAGWKLFKAGKKRLKGTEKQKKKRQIIKKLVFLQTKKYLILKLVQQQLKRCHYMGLVPVKLECQMMR